jgi:regulator of sirC expression with transglutaminase-like and TPR domain
LNDNSKTIKALIRLIDDPDILIFSEIKDKLLGYGTEAVPYLEDAWLKEPDAELFQDRVNVLLRDIQLESCLKEINEWILSPSPDLLEGALFLAKFQYPEIDVQDIKDKVEEVKKDIWLEINDHMTSFEKIKVFNKVFFNIHGFHGDKKDFHNPSNSFVNEVFARKKGNPLSLSLLYSYIAQELNIPVFGVNLPNHFVLAYVDNNNILDFIGERNTNGILFYINAFNKGAIFNKSDIESFLGQIKVNKKVEYFLPCSNIDFIRRMVVNLVYAYNKQGNELKAKSFEKIKELFY